MMRMALRWGGRLWLILTYVFIAMPLIFVILGSFNERTLGFPPDGLTLKWYHDIPPSFLDAFKVSLIVAVAATALAIPCGVMGALAIVRGRFPGRDLLSGTLLSPIMLPMLVVGISLYQFYLLVWRMTGVGLAGTLGGMIVAHSTFTTAYVLRSVIAVLSTMDRALEEAALDLGASRWTAFRRVTLPMIQPGVVAGAVLAFLVSFDNLPISLFLTGPGLTPLPIVIFNYIEFNLDPMILAVSTIVVTISVGFIVLLERAMGLARLMGLHDR